MKVIKATDAERAAYATTRPVYPLYGYITVDGRRCAVEDLRGSWSAPDPVYETLAPTGFRWSGGEGTRSQLCHSLRDVAARASVGLEKGNPL